MTLPPAPGPTGVAAGPPADLAARSLPLEIVTAGTVLYRFHNSAFGPVFFGPGPGAPPTYRFDSRTGLFGVLYVAKGYRGAMIETMLRNPAFDYVEYAEIAKRSVSLLVSVHDLRLVQLCGAGLQRLGLRNDISTGPYEAPRAWADALWSHPATPDGLMYHSRHDPSEICLAIFERPTIELKVNSTARLTADYAKISEALTHYGKWFLPPTV